jgi:hypothetical protein
MAPLCLSRVCHQITQRLCDLAAEGVPFSEPIAYRKPQNRVLISYAPRDHVTLGGREARAYLEQLKAGHRGKFAGSD